jgi:uncharacterized iron-regulated membrane protein
MKKNFRSIHRYLSFLAGIFIFGSCITGTILVFREEIEHNLHSNRYYVKAQGQRLPVQKIIDIVLKQVANSKFLSITIYNDADRSLEVGLSVKEEFRQAKTKLDKGAKDNNKPNLSVFVNPYTGELLGEYKKKQSFLYNVEMYHRFLLAGKNSIGDQVIGVSTIFFFMILITGLVLWWPKTKALLFKKTKITWTGNTKKLIHDLHIITGFYTSLFLIIITLSGTMLKYKWASQALFVITGTKSVKEPSTKFHTENNLEVASTLSLDSALKNLKTPINTAEFYTMRASKDLSSPVLTVNVLSKNAVEKSFDTYYINAHTGEIIAKQLFNEYSLGQRIKILIEPIHTGSIFGLATKIISIIISLLSLIFPITGLLMWLNRTKKSRMKTVS